MSEELKEERNPEDCTHDCSTCSSNCSSRDPKSFIEKTNEYSHIRKVIGIVSGKGGVGKSMVTSIMSVLSARAGFNTAIMDADITGPSIPKAFGMTEQAWASAAGLMPVPTETGIKVMSVNLLLDDATTPVIWRGPILAGTVKQFWTEVIWDDVDFMFVDMPPGTADVSLTVFQSIPLDGIIVVTSPQELVSMIVQKAVKMANMMNIPILGLVENMSYIECPDCGKHIPVFGESHVDEVAKEYNLPVLGKLPIVPALAAACDGGSIEKFEGDWLDGCFAAVKALLDAEDDGEPELTEEESYS